MKYKHGKIFLPLLYYLKMEVYLHSICQSVTFNPYTISGKQNKYHIFVHFRVFRQSGSSEHFLLFSPSSSPILKFQREREREREPSARERERNIFSLFSHFGVLCRMNPYVESSSFSLSRLLLFVCLYIKKG